MPAPAASGSNSVFIMRAFEVVTSDWRRINPGGVGFDTERVEEDGNSEGSSLSESGSAAASIGSPVSPAGCTGSGIGVGSSIVTAGQAVRTAVGDWVAVLAALSCEGRSLEVKLSSVGFAGLPKGAVVVWGRTAD